MNIKCHKSKTASENCQFESRYKNIVDQHYSNFAEDFFEHDQKFYCPFHAPMEAVKIAEPNSKKTKKEIFWSYPEIEESEIYSDKFWNVIYGIINQQTALFLLRFKLDHFKSDNTYISLKEEEKIFLERVIFPQLFLLTKDNSQNLGEEYQKYCEAVDVTMPRMNFDNCEFCVGIEAKSGSQGQQVKFPQNTVKITQEIYPQLTIFGANFYGAYFKGGVIFIGVNFAPKKGLTSKFVSFNEAKFECFSIEFSKSEFRHLTFVNSKIFCHQWLGFGGLLIYEELDISCDIGADEDLKKIKAKTSFSSFNSFGDGKLICQNRIFENDVFFQGCEFYQAPDFLNTRFDGKVDFERSKFFEPSSFKYEYYSNYRTIKFEMARKNLYREEKLFHRYEEKCVSNQPIVELQKIKTFLKNLKTRFQKKSKLAAQPAKKLEKKSAEKFEIFLSHQSLSEKIFSSLFELICRRGTSFNRIIWVFFCLNFLIFPWFYLSSYLGPNLVDKIFWENSSISFWDLVFKSFRNPVFYVLHPFYGASELENFKFSCELFISTIQSIFNVAIYVIFGFMLRKRFKMSD